MKTKNLLTILLMMLFCGNAWGATPTKCTTTDDLVAGDVYYISGAATYAANSTVMGTSTGGNNVPASTFSAAPCEFTLRGDATNGWAFEFTGSDSKTYYLDATNTTSSNYLKRNETNGDYCKFTISFGASGDNYNAVITCKGKSSRNIIRMNGSIYSCYTSGQSAVYLYKKVADCTAPGTALSVSGADAVEMGQTSTYSTNGGNGSAIEWSVVNGTGSATIDGGVLTPVSAGTVTVKATQEVSGGICGGTVSKLVTIANQLVNVTWTVNGEQVGDVVKVETGSKVSTVPSDPTAPTGKVFMGWTKVGVTNPSTAPTDLFKIAANSPTINAATEFKAVFATQGGTPTQYAKLALTSTTIGSAFNGGEKILIINNAGSKALSSTAASTSGYLSSTSVSISSDVATCTDATLIWEVELTGSSHNNFRLKQGTNYLSASKNAYGNLSLVSPAATNGACNWVLSTSTTTNAYYFTNTLSSAARIYYNDTYTSAGSSTTTTNYKQCIYVQQVSYSDYTTDAGVKLALPIFSPVAGTYGSTQNVTITALKDVNGGDVAGAQIYYNMGNSPADPTSESTPYSGAIEVSTTQTIKAIAYKAGRSHSDVATALFTIDATKAVANPTFSKESGTHFVAGATLSVELSCETEDAEIHYTSAVDGETPADPTSASTLYVAGSPISVTKKTIIKAIAIKQGMSNSQVVSATYYCDYTATFSVPEGKTAPASLVGSTITMPTAPAEKCNGYTFQGWARTTKSGTTTTPSDMTSAGADYEMDKSRMFYAVYKRASDNTYWTSFECLTPTLDAPSALAIGKSKIDKTRMVSINLTGTNIIGTTTLAISGDDAAKFVVSPASIDAPDGGSLSQAVTISYTPTEKKTDAATLTISSTNAESIEVALSGEGANMSFRRFLTKCKPTVFFDVLNVHEHYAEIDNEGHVPAYTPTGTCGGKEFIGWSETKIEEVQQEQPTLIDFATHEFNTDPFDPAAGITVYAVFASPNGGKVGALDSVTDVFTSYATVSDYQNSTPRVYGRWSVLGGGVSEASDVKTKMGKQAIVLQKQSGDGKATMTANIKGFMGLNAYVATTDNSVYYTISYSTDGGTNWTDLVGSTNHNGIRTKLLKQPTKLAEPVDALVKFELTSASSSGSSYRIYVDDVKIYSKPRTYWYSDFSTNCDKGSGASATMTFDVNGGTGEIAVISTPGVDVTLPDASSTSLECYTLAGWKVDGKESPEEGEDIYMFAPGDKYLLNHSVTMVAQWEKDLTTPAATLIFHKGYNNTEEVVVNCHSTAGEIEAIRPECAAGDGFEFVGWTRTPLPAEGQVEKPELFNIAKEITTISAETINLYPVWNGGVLTGTDYTAGATGNYVIAAEVSTGNWVAIPNAPVINEKGKISGETIKVGTTDGGVKYVLEGDAEGYVWAISNNDSKGQRFFDGEWYIYPTGGGSNTSSNISRGKTGDAVSNYGWTVSHNTYWEIASTDGTTTPATVNTKGLVYRTTDGYGFGQYTVGSVSATYKEVRILPIYRRDGKYMPTPECRSVINAEESSKGLVSMNGATIKSNGRLIITKMYGPAIAGEITGADAGKFAVTFGEKYTESEIEYIPYTVAYTPTAVGERATATITFDDGSGNTWTAESEGVHPSITVRGMAVPETFVIAAKVGEEYIALPENTSGSAGAVSGTTIQVGMVGGQLSAFKVADALHYTMTEVASEIYQHLSSHTAAFYGNASGLRSASGATATFYDWVITLNENGTVRMKANQGGTNPVTYNSTSGKFATTVDESTAGANYYRDLYLLPILNYMDMQASVVEWFPTKVLVELANGDIWTAMKDASATSQTRFGEGAWGSAAAVDYATYGTKLCVFNTGDLTIHSGANLSVKVTVNKTDYQMNVVVPIIISGGNKSVKDDEPFVTLTPAVYNNMDLVIRDGAHLNADGTLAQNTFHNVTIYPNSKLRIDYGKAFQANGQITLRGGKDEIYDGSKYEMTSYGAEPQLYAMGALHHPNQAIIYYEKRVDTKRMYQLSLPANVPLANVTYGDGTPMAINTQLWAETWDGQAAANEDASEHWILEKDFDPAQFTMGVGYTVSCKRQVKGQTYSIMRFPMTKHESGKSEAEFQEYVNVKLWQKQEGTGRLNSYGWNYIGNPYMTAIEGRIYIDNEDEEETEDLEYITYMSPDGSMYYSGEASTTRMLPFRSYFVQVPCNGKLVFATDARQPNAPARKQTLEDLVKFYLALQQGATSDSACMRISESYSDSYVIGQDLEKMSIGPNTSVYYIDKNGNLAFDAVKPAHATNWIPVGFYAPSKGNMTFSLNVKEGTMNLKHVYLQDAVTKAQTDLLTDDYVFTTDQTGKIDNRFYIAVEFTQEVPTGIDDVEGTRAPFKFINEDKLFIEYKGVIYDANGKRVNL